jgi:hypothetical protein
LIRDLGAVDLCGFLRGWIRSFDPSTPEASGFAIGIEGRPVDLEVSKEGELYCLSMGRSGSPGSVSKIRYAGGNALSAPQTVTKDRASLEPVW